jgi:hypothetical protein
LSIRSIVQITGLESSLTTKAVMIAEQENQLRANDLAV